MRKLYRTVAMGCAAFAVMAMGQRGVGQDVFTLSFEGPASLAGSADEVKTDTYFATLTHAGEGNNAQGWSISMSSEGGTITSVTTDGTIADKVENGGLFSGGFNKTQTIDPAKNPGFASGAVSAVVLSLTEGTTLPQGTSNRILKMGYETKIPAGGGVTKLLYVDGLIGSGQKVTNVVTQDGGSQTPVKTPLTINLVEVVSCCDDAVNVGFSKTAVKGGSGFDSILDSTDLCSGSGTLDVEVPEGETGSATAYATIVSNLEEGGVQGWSFSILLTGDEVEITSSTTAGTTADKVENGGLFSGGFNKTQIVDPAKQTPAGKRGTVSGVVLSLTEGTTLPLVSTESVLAIGLASKNPQTDAPQVGTLSFTNGLVGAGQPVNNVLTVGGGSQQACNFATAKVDVNFIVRSVPPAGEFIRGNSNDDSKIDIADPIFTINALFRGGPPSTCQDAADANDDGIVDASDAVYMIDYLFRGQASPPAPFPDCGPDPTDDTGDEDPLNDLSCDRGSAPNSCP